MGIKHLELTDKGLKRLKNEDAVLFLDLRNGYFLAAVADGMGGHNGGGYASSKTVELLKYYFQELDLKKDKLELEVDKAIKEINLHLYEESLKHQDLTNMGTTLTLLIFNDKEGYLVQIGDSRLYKLVDNVFFQLTEDQTIVNELYKAKIITKEEMKTHPKKHILTNALGGMNKCYYAKQKIKLENGFYLLCSDGLTNEVSDDLISNILRSDLTIEEKGEMLIDLSIKSGGYDNISIVIIEVKL